MSPERLAYRLACPKCGENTKVINSRVPSQRQQRKRRHACVNPTCRYRFTTLEVIMADRDETVRHDRPTEKIFQKSTPHNI